MMVMRCEGWMLHLNKNLLINKYYVMECYSVPVWSLLVIHSTASVRDDIIDHGRIP